MRSFLATLAVIAILCAVGFYAAGWLTYRKTDTDATIEIKTQQIEAAAERAVDNSRELLEDALDNDDERRDVPVRQVTPPPARDELTEPIT